MLPTQAARSADGDRSLGKRLGYGGVLISSVGVIAVGALATVGRNRYSDRLSRFIPVAAEEWVLWVSLVLLAGAFLGTRSRSLGKRYLKTVQECFLEKLIWPEVVLLSLLILLAGVAVTLRIWIPLSLRMVTAAAVAGVAFFIGAALGILASRRPKSGSSAQPASHLYSDVPIVSFTGDRVGRREAIKQGAALLEQAPSAVISLIGRRGVGKTSAVHLLKSYCAESWPGKFLFVDFDAWMLAGGDLANRLLAGIDKQLNRVYLFPDLHRQARQYRILVSGGLAAARLGGAQIHERDLETTRDVIADVLSRIRPTVVLAFDDLDRLEGSELLNVAQAARLLSELPHITVLLVYDSAEVRLVSKPAFELIEKITQDTWELPPLDPKTVSRLLFYSEPARQHKSMLDTLFDELQIPKATVREFNRQFEVVYGDIARDFSTMRDVNRFARALRGRLPAIWKEVDLVDFVLLEYLRVFHRKVWEDISASWWIYIDSQLTVPGSFDDLLEDSDAFHHRLKERVKALLAEEPNSEGVSTALRGLFPKIAKAIGGVSLARGNDVGTRAHSELHLWKYLSLEVGLEEFSETALVDLLAGDRQTAAKWEDSVGMAIAEAAQLGRFRSLVRKLEQRRGQLMPANRAALAITLARKSDRYASVGPGGVLEEFSYAKRLIVELCSMTAEPAALLEKCIGAASRVAMATELAMYAKPAYSPGVLERVPSEVLFHDLGALAADRCKALLLEADVDIFETDPAWGAWVLRRWASFDRGWEGIKTYVERLVERAPERIRELIEWSVDQDTGKPSPNRLSGFIDLGWLQEQIVAKGAATGLREGELVEWEEALQEVS